MPSGFVTRIPGNDLSSCIITSRLFWIVRRRLSTVLCIPLSAPSAPAWSTDEQHEVVFAWTLVSTSTSLRLAIAQPIRNPVIP